LEDKLMQKPIQESTEMLAHGHMIIQDQGLVSRVLKCIGQDVTRKIMMAIMETAKTAAQISEELGIPLSTCYDHITRMKKAGLIVIEGSTVTDKGRHSDLYRCVFRELNLRCGQGRLEVHVVPNEDVASKFYRYPSTVRGVR